MIALIQRVAQASVSVDAREISRIGRGLLILLGVFTNDTKDDANFLAEKAVNLRIFDDDCGVMNLSLLETGGEALCVSQFTLCANTRKGRRPSFSNAMKPDEAEKLYNAFCDEVEKHGIRTARGLFGATMAVELINDGPVTVILNSRETRRLNDRDLAPIGGR